MKDLEKDIKIGLEFLKKGYINTEYGQNNNYTWPFSKTNEDIGSYFLYFPIKDGIVSTIIGSGDQILQAVKDNPKEIHAFDQNPLAIYMAKLKVASLLSLNYEQFKKYYDIIGTKTSNKECNLSLEYYKMARDYLDDDSKIFWDKMYNEGKFKRKSHRFISQGSYRVNTGPNSYENEYNYYTTKENINKVKIYYYNLEFFEAFKKMGNNIKYSSIFLSNIYDWYEPDKQEIFESYIINELSKKLIDNGMIEVYSPPKYSIGYPIKLSETFKNTIMMPDCKKVLVYKKQNKV